MSGNKYLYETTFIVNASLEDPQIETVASRIQETITKNDGTLKSVDKWGRKRLAYPIKKKNNGFYVNIEFEAPPSIVKQLDHIYSLEEQILRALTIRLGKKALKAREITLAAQAAAAAAAAEEAAALPRPETPAKEGLFVPEVPGT